MGRTKRTRNRKAGKQNGKDSMGDLVSLTRWMGTVNWKNIAKIKCLNFGQTGRGVTSTKSITSSTVLFRIPYKLLVTYSTIIENKEFIQIFKLNAKLKIQDLLSAFLVVEKHKGVESVWKYYIASLPKNTPKLPWFSSLEEIKYYPEEFQSSCITCRVNFQESWDRFIDSMNEVQSCSCCNGKIVDIINLESYIWGYTMVNTRGVYVNPDVRNFSKCDILLDEPNIALCPLMDMFNHSDTAENKTEFKQTSEDSWYELVTLNNWRKHDQIFICYGRHDNLKLFTEYGFYLQQNSNDKIKLKPDEILKVLNLKLNHFQYSFLKKHEFLNYDELFISVLGVSFKLKGFLYVACNDGEKNYSLSIFGGKYKESFLEILKHFAVKLILHKKEEYKGDFEKLRDKFCNKDVLNFFNNRLEFVESLENLLKNI